MGHGGINHYLHSLLLHNINQGVIHTNQGFQYISPGACSEVRVCPGPYETRGSVPRGGSLFPTGRKSFVTIEILPCLQ